MPKNIDEGEIVAGLLADAQAAIAHGALPKASAIYQGILALDPDHVVALRQLGGLAIEFGEPRAAVDLFRRGIARDPRDPDMYHGIGTALRLLGHEDEALVAWASALSVDPRHAPALHDRATLLKQRGELAAAGELFRRLAVSQTDHFGALFNRAVILFLQDDFLAAERWFHAAARVDPADPRPLINLAMIYRIWGFVPQAVACLEHAVGMAPDMPDAHWNLANALLVGGDLARGFAEYEWRFRRPGFAERPFAAPRWRGEDLAGRTLLLTAEQGLGDAIHFVRFAAPLAARGATVIVEAPAGLEALFATAPGVTATVPWGQAPPPTDYVLPLLSAPHALGTTWDTLPATMPYLRVPEGAAVPRLAGAFKAGLVWRGNPRHDNDRNRSIPLRAFAPLARVPGVTWYGLQTFQGVEEAAAAPEAPTMTMLYPYMTDFGRSAALIEQLDLVITVDTATAHLAGALGKPVWTLIPRGNDWRWLHGRDDSPWYPSMRLFRQHAPRQWAPTIAAVARELEALLR
jgi:Flp pilus assembly protein TadD